MQNACDSLRKSPSLGLLRVIANTYTLFNLAVINAEVLLLGLDDFVALKR